MIKLSNVSIGDKIRVKKLRGNGDSVRRIKELGLIEDQEILVLQNFGDGNMIIKIQESRIALSSSETENIYGSMV